LIVKQQSFGAGLDCLFELFDCFNFNFNFEFVRCQVKSIPETFPGGIIFYLFYRPGNRTGGGDMVILYQDHIVQAETMIVAAAAGNGVIIQKSHTGDGFSGIKDFDSGSFDFFDKL